MKLPQINKRQISMILLTLASLMLVDTIYQLTMHIRWRCWIPAALAATPASTQLASTQPATTQSATSQSASTRQASSQPATTQTATTQSTTQPAATQTAATQPPKSPDQKNAGPAASQPAKPHELAAGIKKRNIMAEARPKGHGLTLAGVLDNLAFFRSRENQDICIEEGKSGPNGVKVTKIDGTDVIIEYEGKPETMKLFAESPK